jgi:hypothetical protein
MSDNQYLPPEYAAQIAEAQRRQAMAQALLQRSMGFQGAQSQGPVAAKTSPLTWMANSLSGYLAQNVGDKASKDIAGVRQRMTQDEQGELARLQGMPEEQRIPEAQRSQFPRAQALAKALQDQRMKRLEMFGSAVKDTDPQSAARAAQSGMIPPEYQSPQMPAPQEGKLADGTPMVTTTNRKGEQSVQFPPKGVNVNMPGTERAAALGVTTKQLEDRRGGADAAKATYAAATQALDALEQGAKAGGGEEVKQILRKTAQAFGIAVPATAETNELQMALGNAVLGNAAKLRPASDTDLKILAQIVGSINTDPTALTKALAMAQAMSIKDLSGYGQFVDQSLDTIKDDYARQLFAGAKVGYDVPKQLSGPLPYQLEVVRQLQRQGFDISQLQDPTGQPFPGNAKFNVNPTGGFPGVAPKRGTPAAQPTKPAQAAPPPADGRAYTMEEFQRYFGAR